MCRMPIVHTIVRCLVVVLCLLHMSEQAHQSTCGCPQNIHVQEKFCDADFVIRGRVLRTQRFSNYPNTKEREPVVRYTTLVKQVFKGKIRSRYVYLWSYRNKPYSASIPRRRSCVITGNIEHKAMYVDACSWIQRYNTITSHQIRGLQNSYKDTCLCQVGSGKCGFIKKKLHPCYQKYSTCEDKNKNKCGKRCKWSKNKYLKRCLKRTRRKQRKSKRKRKVGKKRGKNSKRKRNKKSKRKRSSKKRSKSKRRRSRWNLIPRVVLKRVRKLTRG